MKKLVMAVAAFAAIASSVAVAGIGGTHAFAATPVEIKPICTSVDAQVGLFEVTNKDGDNVTIGYNNPSSNDQGSFNAVPGTSRLYVKYNVSDPNNQTFFTDPNAGTTSTNMNVGTRCGDDQLPVTPVTPTPATCTDASDASQLSVTWTGDSQITITTKEPLPVCATVTLYYSTYRMPDSYDGNGFNATAYPQTHLSSYQFNIEAGSYGAWIMNVPAPDYCYNVQADVYYAPHINGINEQGQGYGDDGTVLQQSGHGTQNIASQVFARDLTRCDAGRGAGMPTITTSTPTVLPNTGAEDTNSNLLSAVLSFAFGSASLGALGIRALRR